jgi:hypothetical protein
MVFNAIFNNISFISWRSVLLVKETGLHGENTDRRNKSLVNVITSSTPHHGFELTTLVVISTDYIGSCKSNYHTTTTTTVPK